MHCEVTLRIPSDVLTLGERRNATFRKGRELAASLTHQGSRLDEMRGALIEKFYGDLQEAAQFAQQVHQHLTTRTDLAAAVKSAEFTIELKITDYIGTV